MTSDPQPRPATAAEISPNFWTAAARTRGLQRTVVLFALLLIAATWRLWTPQTLYPQAPLFAVVYHQIGSLAVLLNAMRLLWFDRSATSPTLRRMRQASRSLDQWMERYLNFDEFLHWLGHHWKWVTGSLFLLLLLVIGLSGLTSVQADEVAVVRRFGQPLEGDLGPGLYWRWPWPIRWWRLRRAPGSPPRTTGRVRCSRHSSTLAAGLNWLSRPGTSLACGTPIRGWQTSS